MKPDTPPTTLARGRYLELRDASGWEYVHRIRGTGAVALIAVTDDGALVLVEQWRAPFAANSIELPAGLVGDDAGQEGEAMVAAARRELEEETGFRARSLRFLFEGASSAGHSSETIALYLATGLTRVGPGGGDGSENIRVHLVPLAGAEGWLMRQQAAGKVLDIKLWAALLLARQQVARR